MVHILTSPQILKETLGPQKSLESHLNHTNGFKQNKTSTKLTGKNFPESRTNVKNLQARHPKNAQMPLVQTNP